MMTMSDLESSVRSQPFLGIPYNNKSDSREDSLRREPLLPRSIAWKLLLAALAILLLGAGLVWRAAFASSTHSTKLNTVLQKNWNPFKPPHHGRVNYFFTDTEDKGRIYRREFFSRCGYGILVFNIGPARDNLPYQFDIYNNEYAYSDNDGMCLILPSYKGKQSSSSPYWMPEDPTEIQVGFNQLTKISSRVATFPDSKELPDKVHARLGDYVVMAKGNFYDPDYLQQLEDVVHSWRAEDDASLQLNLEYF